MPTGRSCGVGLWKALSVSATKIATKAALTTMKPAIARYLAGCLRPSPGCLAATCALPFRNANGCWHNDRHSLGIVNKCLPTYVDEA